MKMNATPLLLSALVASALATPSGDYVGSLMITDSQSVDVTLAFVDEAHLNFLVSAEVEGRTVTGIDCENEGYSYSSDNTLMLTGLHDEGNCIHDNLEENGAELESVSFDPESDKITIKLADYDFSLELTKKSTAIFAFRQLKTKTVAAPKGVYKGSVKLLSGKRVSVTVDVGESWALSTLALKLQKGGEVVECKGVHYNYLGDLPGGRSGEMKVTLEKSSKKGDCTYDAFQSNMDATLSSVVVMNYQQGVNNRRALLIFDVVEDTFTLNFSGASLSLRTHSMKLTKQ